MVIPGLIVSTCFVSIAVIVWFVVIKLQPTDANGHVNEGPKKKQSTTSSSDTWSDKTALEDDEEELSPGCDTPSTNPGTPSARGLGLSRRQKKNNRKREKEDGKKQASGGGGGSSSEVSTPTTARSKKKSLPCKQYEKLQLQDHEIYYYLLHYVLNQDQLRRLGYPMESELHPGKAYIYKDPEFSGNNFDDLEYFEDEQEKCSLDANATEFVPKCGGGGSDTEMGDASSNFSSTLNISAKEFVPSSSSSSLQDLGGANCDNPPSEAASSDKPSMNNNHLATSAAGSTSDEKRCIRCSKSFFVSEEGEYISTEKCSYHWGKMRHRRAYTCCAGRDSRKGCTVGQLHVWHGVVDVGLNGPLEGYARTKTKKNFPANGNYGIYALDCEMCFTAFGLELVKVTVVGIDGRLVYDTLVQPEHYIIDYNTRFSGISAKDLKKGPCKTLKEVQNDVNGFVNAHTILIGHGLENDLRALKLIHSTVIDTSIVFPHYYGLPYRRSLKSLAFSYLKREIQAAEWGHDSYEDARACAELMLWKVRKDKKATNR